MALSISSRAKSNSLSVTNLAHVTRAKSTENGAQFCLVHFADIVYRFRLQKQSKFKNFTQIHLLILDQWWGRLNDILGAHPSLAHAWRQHCACAYITAT